MAESLIENKSNPAPVILSNTTTVLHPSEIECDTLEHVPIHKQFQMLHNIFIEQRQVKKDCKDLNYKSHIEIDDKNIMNEPLYQRRHYWSLKPNYNESDLLDLQSIKRAKMNEQHSLHSPELRLSESKNEISFPVDVLLPLSSSLAYVFSNLHGIVDAVKRFETGDFSEPLNSNSIQSPTNESRLNAVMEYCNIMNAMSDWLNNRHISKSMLYSSTFLPFSLSHSIFDLYCILWYSPSIAAYYTVTDCSVVEDCYKNENSEDHRLLKQQDESSELFSLHSINAIELSLSKMKIALLLWYIKHERPVPAQQLTKQIVRAANIFNLVSNDSPPILLQECSNHLSRLLLLCHFDEFYHMVSMFASKGDRIAQLFLEHVFNGTLTSSISRYRLNLLDPQRHYLFLNHLQTITKCFIEFIQTHDELNDCIETSIFMNCLCILSGDNDQIDEIIQKIFPNCWLSSFILGFFWKSFNPSTVFSKMYQLMPSTIEELGDLVAFFFNSWLEHHPSIESISQLKISEIPIASILSNDIDQLVSFLQLHPTYFVSPILIDLITEDHHILHAEAIATDIYLNYSDNFCHIPRVCCTFLLRACIEGYNEYAQQQELTRLQKIQNQDNSTVHHLGTGSRHSRYGLNDNSLDTEDTSCDMQKPDILKKDTYWISREDVLLNDLNQLDILIPFLLNIIESPITDKKELAYTDNTTVTLLGYLFLKLKTATSFQLFRYYATLVLFIIKHRHAIMMFLVTECLIILIKDVGKQTLVSDCPWESLLFGAYCDSLALSARKLKRQIHIKDKLKHRHSCFQTTTLHKMYLLMEQYEHNEENYLQDYIIEGPDNHVIETTTPSFLDDILDQSPIKPSPPEYPICCDIPDSEFTNVLLELQTNKIKSPRLAFFLILATYHTDLLNMIHLSHHIDDVTQHEFINKQTEIRYKDATQWIFKFLCQQCMTVKSYIEYCLDVILAAVKIGLYIEPVLNKSQFEEFVSFWISYTRGMFLNLFTVSRTSRWSPEGNLGESCHQLNHYISESKLRGLTEFTHDYHQSLVHPDDTSSMLCDQRNKWLMSQLNN